MGIGTVVCICLATFFVMGGLRRLFWRRHYGRWGHYGHYGRRRMGGYFLDRVLDELGADDQQRTQVRSIREKLFGGLRDLRGARHELMGKLLDHMAQDQLAADELDAAAEELVGKARAQIKQALVELHSTLTPDQRRKAVELARRRLAYFGG
jgi:Spy/CpxP family protein refolding chaperone